jgi:hypothetical protein
MNTNYYYIKNILEEYANFHPLLMSSELSFSDQRTKFHENQTLFPVLYGVVNSVNRNKQTLNWNVRIWCLDLLKADRGNEKHIMNTTFEILNDFYNFLTFRKVDFRALSSNLTPLNNYDLNRMNGWYLDITIETKSIQCIDLCDYPNQPPCPPDSNFKPLTDWKLVDTDGNILQSGSQPCGEDLTIIIDLGE